jgi:hypothetical protein
MALPTVVVTGGEDAVAELSCLTCAGELVRLPRDVLRTAQPNARVQPRAALLCRRGCTKVRRAACRLQRYVRPGRG